MASEDKIVHEAYTVCAPASLPVQIESLACYGSYLNNSPINGYLETNFDYNFFFFNFRQ